MTWVDGESRTLRVERVTTLAALALLAEHQTMERISSWPTRMDAVQAA